MSDIVLPNSDQDNNPKDKFNIELSLSCMDFLKSQGIMPGQQPNPKILDYWADKLQHSYQFEVPTEEVIRFFNIPENHRNLIDEKKYSVHTLILEYEPNYMIAKIQCTLTLNELPFIKDIKDKL